MKETLYLSLVLSSHYCGRENTFCTLHFFIFLSLLVATIYLLLVLSVYQKAKFIPTGEEASPATWQLVCSLGDKCELFYTVLL